MQAAMIRLSILIKNTVTVKQFNPNKIIKNNSINSVSLSQWCEVTYKVRKIAVSR